MARLSKKGSSVILGVLGLGTYLLISTVFMLKSKGELNGITLVMPRRLEEKKLEAQLAKERARRIDDETKVQQGSSS